MDIVIIKYNAGNIQSVRYALERIGASAVVSDDPATIAAADKVIFPGVGEASTAMDYLKERKLDQLIISLKQPVLGICLGMQLMCKYSEENNTYCMGIFNEQVKRFEPGPSSLKIPQMGWNNIQALKTPLFNSINENSFCYFVHGYYAEYGLYTIATTNYGIDYSAALHKNNFYGTQFHPEKSAGIGEQLLRNFIAL
jgi:glutamine amidotransferase